MAQQRTVKEDKVEWFDDADLGKKFVINYVTGDGTAQLVGVVTALRSESVRIDDSHSSAQHWVLNAQIVEVFEQ